MIPVAFLPMLARFNPNSTGQTKSPSTSECATFFGELGEGYLGNLSVNRFVTGRPQRYDIIILMHVTKTSKNYTFNMCSEIEYVEC
jgi:hypothetical protein